MAIQALHVDIYEEAAGDSYPVVQHVFRGKTRAEAMRYYRSHLHTDSFLRGCVERGRWRDVSCSIDRYWRTER